MSNNHLITFFLSSHTVIYRYIFDVVRNITNIIICSNCKFKGMQEHFWVLRSVFSAKRPWTFRIFVITKDQLFA